jgi:hypothetical protein
VKVSLEPLPGLPHCKEITAVQIGFKIPTSQIQLRIQNKVFLSLARNLGVWLCC